MSREDKDKQDLKKDIHKKTTGDLGVKVKEIDVKKENTDSEKKQLKKNSKKTKMNVQVRKRLRLRAEGRQTGDRPYEQIKNSE